MPPSNRPQCGPHLSIEIPLTRDVLLSLLEENGPDIAIDVARQAIRCNPQDGMLRVHFAEICLEAENFLHVAYEALQAVEKAIEYFQAIRVEEEEYKAFGLKSAYSVKGEIFSRLASLEGEERLEINLTSSVVAFEAALRFEQGRNVHLYYALAKNLMHFGAYERANYYLEEFAQIWDEEPRLMLLEVLCKIELAQLIDAKNLARALLHDRMLNEAGQWEDLAECFVRFSDLIAAESCLYHAHRLGSKATLGELIGTSDDVAGVHQFLN